MFKLWIKSNNIKSFAVVHGTFQQSQCAVCEVLTGCYEVSFYTHAGTFINTRVSAQLLGGEV